MRKDYEKKTVTIFGSSQPKQGEEQFLTAYNLGVLLARNNFNVCTGGFQGIMNAVSKGASENGAEVIGVTVDLWGAMSSKYLTKEVKCKSLFERISTLIELGDAYVILQGGTGTLLELAAVWEMMNKGMMKIKPVVCHSSMWNDIVKIIDKQLEHEKKFDKIVKCVDDLPDIVEEIKRNV